MSTQTSRSAARLMLSPAVILLLVWMIVPQATVEQSLPTPGLR